jgi:hypothetical protein
MKCSFEALTVEKLAKSFLFVTVQVEFFQETKYV